MRSISGDIHAQIMSRLDYCNMLYEGLTLKLTWTWQLAQNTVVRILEGALRDQPVPFGLHELH